MSVDLYMSRGLAYLELAHRDQSHLHSALRDFLIAQERSKRSTIATLFLGMTYCLGGEKDLAEAEFASAHEHATSKESKTEVACS